MPEIHPNRLRDVEPLVLAWRISQYMQITPLGYVKDAFARVLEAVTDPKGPDFKQAYRTADAAGLASFAEVLVDDLRVMAATQEKN